jgi:hypothetical protein
MEEASKVDLFDDPRIILVKPWFFANSTFAGV